MENRDAHAAHVQFLHPVGQRVRVVLFTLDGDGTDEARGDVLNVLFDFRIGLLCVC